MNKIEQLIQKYTELHKAEQMVESGEVLQDLKNLPQSISREAVEKLRNRYKRLEECEKDNIWGCALRCFIKDLNSLLPNKSNDSD